MAIVRNVFVVTHPEATHHVERRVGGWFDSDLTEVGAAHAQRIGAALAERVGEHSELALFTSDLRRTRQTADAIADRFGVGAVTLPDLREKSYGEAEGREQAWLDARFIPPPPTGERMEHHEGIDGAETKAAWARRVYRAMTGILDGPAATTVIVTHGGSATYVIAHWIGMPVESLSHVRFNVRPGSISHLQEDDFFRSRSVVSLNDTSHLED